MRDLIDMWRNTRMVVLTAMSASLYAAILIPFKVLPIIPGVTELRPANAVPVVCSFLFGPAGAWGAAIGNVIGDFFGGIGPGDLFGFAGNLLYGLVPYKAWEALSDGDPVPRTVDRVGSVSHRGTAVERRLRPVHRLGHEPSRFRAVSRARQRHLVQQQRHAIVLAPLLLAVIYPRVKRGAAALLRHPLPTEAKPLVVRRIGLLIVAVATIGGMVVGNLLSNGSLHLPFLALPTPVRARAPPPSASASCRSLCCCLLAWRCCRACGRRPFYGPLPLVAAECQVRVSVVSQIVGPAVRPAWCWSEPRIGRHSRPYYSLGEGQVRVRDVRIPCTVHHLNVPPSAPSEAIRLDHLSFTYADQQTRALDDVSLTVRRGEMVVVMGATGAGKTTLAKCLNRTIPAFQAGTLTGISPSWDDGSSHEGVADLAGVVGLVSQDFEAQLFATNVLQEVAFGMEQLGVPADEMRRRVPQALATVGLVGLEHRDPSTLSGGEKQRLAIAATLALQPASWYSTSRPPTSTRSASSRSSRLGNDAAARLHARRHRARERRRRACGPADHSQ